MRDHRVTRVLKGKVRLRASHINGDFIPFCWGCLFLDNSG